jgi:peptidoglycan hydrolase CwlO-like protein
MKEYIKIILIVIVLVGIGWIWRFNQSILPEPTLVTNQKIVDSLEIVINSCEHKQKTYDSTITNLNIEIVNLKEQIAQDDKKLAELKKKINEKTNNITKFSTTDITNFVSDRYRDSIGR